MTNTPRPPIFPSEWLDAPPTYIDRGVEHGLDTPMPTAEIERLKAHAAAEYAPPFTAEEIKAVLESDRKLPCWDDLRGCAHGATGALSSEEFVRILRDDWEIK